MPLTMSSRSKLERVDLSLAGAGFLGCLLACADDTSFPPRVSLNNSKKIQELVADSTSAWAMVQLLPGATACEAVCHRLHQISTEQLPSSHQSGAYDHGSFSVETH